MGREGGRGEEEGGRERRKMKVTEYS